MELKCYSGIPINYTDQTLLITSINAIRSLISISAYRDYKKILAIGRKTADFACKSGFKNVIPAGENVMGLLEYALENCRNERLLYISGREISYPLSIELQKHGLSCDRIVVYEMIYNTHLSAGCVDAIVSREVRGVMFFSLNSAKTFLNLINQHNLYASIQNLTAYSLSEKISKFLSQSVWRHVYTAVKPTHESLIATIVNNS